MKMKEFFPPPKALLELEPEEAGQYLLICLNALVKEKGQNKLNRFNITIHTNPDLVEYAGELKGEVSKVLSEAWMWLFREGFLAPIPNEQGIDWVFITRRGQQISSKKDFFQFRHIGLLPKKVLDTRLAQKVWGNFIRGDFETAIFAAFKEVEIRIREAAELKPTDIGVDLARKAFNTEEGPLTDSDLVGGERQAHSDLFAGALGSFKSPSSHRDVNYDDPIIAVSLILFANTLIKIIEKRAEEYKVRKAERLKLEASV